MPTLPAGACAEPEVPGVWHHGQAGVGGQGAPKAAGASIWGLCFGSPGVGGPFLLVPWSQRRVLWPDQALAFPVLRPQKPKEHGLGMAQPAGPSLTRPFLAEAPTAQVPHSPGPGALSSAPGPKQIRTASTGPELLLLPPSSFVPCGAAAPARVRPPPPGLGAGALSLVWLLVLLLIP